MNHLFSFLIVCLFTLYSANLQAVSITKTRLFLDEDKRMTDMSVYNSNSPVKVCEVSLKKVGIDGDGLGLDPNLPALPNPAPLVRLAPRKFELGTNQHQAFKLIYRRTPGIDSGEYIGVVAIRCADKERTSEDRVNIKPQLVHNIPLIVRVGKLSVVGEFLKAEKVNQLINIEFMLQGGRSVTGDFQVVDKSSGQVLVEKKKVSVYPKFDNKKLSLQLPESSSSDLEVVFKEIKESGKLVIKRALTTF